MFRDCRLIRRPFPAKHRLINLFFGKSLTCMESQILTNAVFPFRQSDQVSLTVYGPLSQVKVQSRSPYPVLRDTLFPAQMGSNPSTQFSQSKRFCQIVVSADSQPSQNIRFLRLCSQKYDRTVRQPPDPPASLKTILSGHHHIQDNTVCPPQMLFPDFTTAF